MRNATRDQYEAYLANVANMNGINDATKKFTVDPSVEQALENVMHESGGFITRVNVIGVPEQEGEKLGLDIGTTVASTTDTLIKDREAIDPTDIDLLDRFRCEQTNFDTAIRYAKLDMWAKFADFEDRIGMHIVRQIERDRLMIAWHGASRAATSDRVLNKMLQDVNIGWLQHARLKAPQRILTEGEKAPGEIRVGAGGDYLNVDAMVMDMVNNLIDVWHQEDTDLVVIIGREIFNDKFFDLVNTYNEPTERNALDSILANKRVGGLQAIRVPFFPARGIAITSLSNLSVYYQEGKRRRTIVDNAKRDRIEDYQSVNEAYVIEDYGMFCYAESDNIKLKNSAGEWA